MNKSYLPAVLKASATIAMIAILGAVSTSCTSEQRKPRPVEQLTGVSVISVAKASLPDEMEAVGTIRAAEMAQLSAQMMGNVVAVHVREGDRVKRGQVLIVLDDSQPRAALDRAQAAVSAADHQAAAAESDDGLAQSTMKRYEDLYNKKSVSPQEFDEIRARARGAAARLRMASSQQAEAKAALSEARTALEYTRVRAPFDGIVTERKVDPGALASPGMPLLTVEGVGRYRLEAEVDETSLRHVKVGGTVRTVIDALGSDGEAIQGRVTQIVPAADPASRSFTVKIEIPQSAGLHSGLFGRAYFQRGERDSLVVPQSAIVDRGQMQGVFVLGPDQIASLRYVTLGRANGKQQVEVLSGLQPGETLVLSPAQRDLAGKRISAEGLRP